ncbi:hypothetical protein ACOME3_001596 [Neoechinorhynchus agilis]
MNLTTNVVVVLLFACCSLVNGILNGKDLLVFTVATDETDGFELLRESLDFYDYDYKVFGLNEKWKGGDVKTSVGGGQKINILKRHLNEIKSVNETLVLYTDGYDVIFNDEPDEIVRKFVTFDKRIIFSAETFCWPDKTLEAKYPEVSENASRFLNSGLFMGYKDDVINLINSLSIKDADDDQLAYTNFYLNAAKRKGQKDVGLDTKSEIFQSLNGAQKDLQITFENATSILTNFQSGTRPSILHGNGPSKLLFNQFSNYLAKRWIPNFGCRHCENNVFDLEAVNRNKWPSVLIGVLAESETPFFEEFLTKLTSISYPQSKIGLVIHNSAPIHDKQIKHFFEAGKLKKSYRLYEHHGDKKLNQKDARNHFIKSCRRMNCDYLLIMDATAHIDEPETLAFLIGLNRSVIAPILRRPSRLFSNFWGAIDENGYYLRSSDYVSIVEDERVGMWNVPHISSFILLKRAIVDRLEKAGGWKEKEIDEDMELTKYLRDSGIFMWATNLHSYGHLVDPESFNSTALHPELYEIFSNLEDWKVRYLHPKFLEYTKQKEIPLEQWRREYLSDLVGVEIETDKFFIQQPCSDVFWYPLLSERFAREMIETVNNTGQWSLGKHTDGRIPGGYENVPTDDIHMTQIGWQDHWHHFLKQFIQPLQMRIFLGYYKDPPQAPLTFVVRYDLSIQDHLRAHHDASTYTLDIALNRAGIDYKAGGVKFIRYNCSLVDTRIGWPVMFPGRLTHIHEGLKITEGTRYILVSFIDP